MNDLPWYGYLFLSVLIAAPAVFFLSTPAPLPPLPKTDTSTTDQPPSVMQPPVESLPPALDTPYTPEELSKFTTEETGIYVAIKGTIFDVTRKAEVYGPGKSYAVFAGKDGSRGLGLSSLKPEDAHDNTEGMDEKDLKVLEDWYVFFEKRYPIVGKVVKEGASKLLQTGHRYFATMLCDGDPIRTAAANTLEAYVRHGQVCMFPANAHDLLVQSFPQRTSIVSTSLISPY